jgi:hypothetical protein
LKGPEGKGRSCKHVYSRRLQKRFLDDLESRLKDVGSFLLASAKGAARTPKRQFVSHLKRFSMMAFRLVGLGVLGVGRRRPAERRILSKGIPLVLCWSRGRERSHAGGIFPRGGRSCCEILGGRSAYWPRRVLLWRKNARRFLAAIPGDVRNKDYVDKALRSEVNFFVATVAPVSASAETGLFRLNVVFGDPDLRAAEAGWGALLDANDSAIAIKNHLYEDFLTVVGKRLRDRRVGGKPVDVDIVSYFSTPMWHIDRTSGRLVDDSDLSSALNRGSVTLTGLDGRSWTVTLSKDDRATRLAGIRAYLSAMIPARARDTAQAFNLWVGERARMPFAGHC